MVEIGAYILAVLSLGVSVYIFMNYGLFPALPTLIPLFLVIGWLYGKKHPDSR